jgi:hypothetical protein
MAFFIPSLILGIAQALTAVGAVVGGVILSQSQKSSSSSNKNNTIVPTIKPGVPESLKPTTQKLTVPDAPAPSFNRGNYGTTQVSSSAPLSPAPTPAAPVAAAPAPEVQATPPEPPQPPAAPVYTGVLAAPIDTVVFVDEPFSENFFADVLFQDFGGQELLSIARSDTVNGQSVVYQPFKDLGIINDQYSPNKLLSIQETSDRFFANFLIKLNGKIPVIGEGPNGATVYFEEGETGSIVIEFINIETNEQTEIQILNAGIIEDIGI